MKHSVINDLRLLDLCDQVGIKRKIRPGKWKNYADKSIPRPMLVGFSNRKRRNCFSIVSQPTVRLSLTPTTNHLSTGLKHWRLL